MKWLKVFVVLLLLLAPAYIAGCLKMTPRDEVPPNVVITISSRNTCQDANCTCLVESRRPRYMWWSCEQGFGKNNVRVDARIYNSTLDQTCEDIRVNGLPSIACLKYDTVSPFYAIRADCTWCCGDRTFTSCSDQCDWGSCQGICEQDSHWYCGCNPHGDKWTTRYNCPILTKDNPDCTCLDYSSWTVPYSSVRYQQGIPPCFGTGPGGSGCHVLNPTLDLTIDCACVLTCNQTEQVRYKCTDGATGQELLFGNCQFHYESSLQGGSFDTIQPCNASAMQNIVQDPLREIPFFMIGQGATFDAFFKAREYCVPNYTLQSIVSLGDSVFHPNSLTITNGSSICWESNNAIHNLTIDSGQPGEQNYDGITRLCTNNLTLGPHTIEDGATGETSTVNVDEEGHVYLTEPGFTPRTLIVTHGNAVNIYNDDALPHTVRRWDNQWGAGASTDYPIASGAFATIPGLEPGQHLFRTTDTNVSTTVFVLSQTREISVTGSGMSALPSSLPPIISARQGEEICFTCETAQGHTLEIMKMISPAQSVFYENRTLGGTKTCCWLPEANPYYIRDAQTGASINVYVTDKKSEYRVELRDHNFKPPILTIPRGTEVCFANPSNNPRTVLLPLPPPGDVLTVPANGKACGYIPNMERQTVEDITNGANLLIFTYIDYTTFVNMSGLGAQPQFPKTVPGGQVCFANNDNIPHNITYVRDNSCSGGRSLGNFEQVVPPVDVFCVSTPNAGAYFFNERSLRTDSEGGTVATDTNITVLCNEPLDYTFYILDEPNNNGSIQPQSLFVLSNDTVTWLNCRGDDYALLANKPLSSNEIDMGVPAGGSITWDGLLVASSTISASSPISPDLLNARLFVADKESFSRKAEFLYTGPATVNNRSVHLATQWLAGDIGDYTLWVARLILGSRAIPAFPVGLSNRVLIGLYPQELYAGSSLEVPSGSNVTWFSVSNSSHTVERSWIAGLLNLNSYPLGNLSYFNTINNAPPKTGIPAGTYAVTEPSTGSSYSVVSSDLDVNIDMRRSDFTPNPLETNLTKNICFRNHGATDKTLLITPPAVSFRVFNEGDVWSPVPNGTYNVYAITGGGARVFVHNLTVYDSISYEQEYSLLIGCNYSVAPGEGYSLHSSGNRFGTLNPFPIAYTGVEPGLPLTCHVHYIGGNAFCSNAACTLSCIDPDGSCYVCNSILNQDCDLTCGGVAPPNPVKCAICTPPDYSCQDRNVYIDGVQHVVLAPNDVDTTWTPTTGSHLFQIEDSNLNNANISLTIYFGNQIVLQNPLPYPEVILEEGDQISWSNLAAFGGVRMAVEEYLEPVTLEASAGSTSCYLPPINGTYLVEDISPTGPLIGSMQVIVGADEESGTDYVEMMNSSGGMDIATTPFSTVCWRSADGNSYVLETMSGVRNVPPNFCWVNPPGGVYEINETQTGMKWLVTSSAGDFEIPMFFDTNIFNPPTATVRPNTDFCLRNNDVLTHRISLCRLLPNFTTNAPPCSLYCNETFPGFSQTWTNKTNVAVAGSVTDYQVNITLLDPPLTSATVRVQFDDCGWLDVNGVRVMQDFTCPEDADNANCGCCRTGGCSGPCVLCGDWTGPIDITNQLHAGLNRLDLHTVDSYGVQKGYIMEITGTRGYGGFARDLLPGQTECLDLATIPDAYAAICSSPVGIYNFSDNETGDSLIANVTSVCDSEPVAKIARKLNKYDDQVFTDPSFDIVPGFNSHGPGWPSIVTSEVGLGPADVACICRQLRNITAECPRCTTVFPLPYSGAAGDAAFANSVLRTCGDSVDAVGLFVDGNALASSLPICDTNGNCNFTALWDNIADFGAYLNHELHKPSVIMSYKMNEDAANGWTLDTIGRMYEDFYSTPVSHLAGAGIFGIAQTCYDENELNGDCFTTFSDIDGIGLVTGAGTARQPVFDSWFSSCGKYYYNSEGLTMTTFSANETNSSLCDSSRIMDLYQEYKCYAD